MIKTREDSRIEVWKRIDIQSINNKNGVDIEILQIERGNSSDYYIVEVADKIDSANKKSIVEEIIQTIENELDASWSSEYVTKEGVKITSADSNEVYDWFNEYKKILRKRYSEGETGHPTLVATPIIF